MVKRARALRHQDERLNAYREIDRLLVAERVVIVPFHYDRTALIHRPWVDGYVPHPLLIEAPLDWLTVDEEARNKAGARQT